MIHRRMMQELPGTTDNASWFTLRMLPGVRASGEPTDELMVWGSQSGESAMYLDGMRLFSSTNFNKQIGIINPMIMNDIQLEKNNHEITLSSHTGAVAHVSSRKPNFNRKQIEGQFTTQLVSLYGSVPIANRFFLNAALRRSMYDVYKSKLLNSVSQGFDTLSSISTNNNANFTNEKTNSSFRINPEYKYWDYNINAIGYLDALKKHQLSFRLYRNKEDFNYSYLDNAKSLIKGYTVDQQYAYSASYKVELSSSKHLNLFFSSSKAWHNEERVNSKKTTNDIQIKNHVINNQLLLNYSLALGNHKLETNMQYHSFKTGTDHLQQQQDLFSIGCFHQYQKNQWNIQSKLKINNNLNQKQFTVEPSLFLNYRFNDSWQMHLSSSYNHQSLTRTYDLSTNYLQTIWTLNHPIKSFVNDLNLNYSYNSFLLGVRPFYKKIKNYRSFEGTKIS